MIDRASIAGLLEHDHRLEAYCPRCDAWRVLPLANLVPVRHGDRRLPIKFPCQKCGAVGQLQVRSPVSKRRPGGWIKNCSIAERPQSGRLFRKR